MVQESAHDSPSWDGLTCSRCGYTLQEGDVFEINAVGDDGKRFSFAHCICYLCGHEWVE